MVTGTDRFEGEDWEKSFATAIRAEWKPSNVGLDDIRLGNCCWGAKTIKSTNPFAQKSVRLISGRNSPAYSFGTSDVTKIPINELGSQVIGIWNSRVSEVRQKFAHARTAVLIKGPKLLSCSLFEFETVRLEPERFTWTWNKNQNLVGHVDGQHRVTWQPHGSQFTMI